MREASWARRAGAGLFSRNGTNPLISGIGWESELIGITRRRGRLRRTQWTQNGQRAHCSPEAVIAACPDVILASWCGKKVRAERIAARPGWVTILAVTNNRIHEIKSPLILQPGPAALTDGLEPKRHQGITRRLHAADPK